MTSFAKNLENAAGPAAPARPQPVALEVPVTVNGARTVDGSDKREPFSEPSQTVLVFGHGAVIRVTAALAPGQLIFLTNEKTKKEVVCQVVKSKSDGNAVGYVELRFTEPAPGFWGMRFPSDTVLPQAVARPAGPPVVPVPPKAAPPKPAATATAPVAPLAAKPVSPASPIASKPAAPAPPMQATLSEEPLRSLLSPRPSLEASASTLPKEPEPPSPASLPLADAKPVFSSTPASSHPNTEELKQQAARLQEQLSSLLFTEASKPVSADKLSVSASQSSVNLAEVAKQVFDSTAPAKEVAPVANSPKSVTLPPDKFEPTSLPVEELKIPSWLAPLARETDASPSTSTVTPPPPPVHAEPPVEVAAESVLPELPEPEVLAGPVEPLRRPETAVFGGQLLGEAAQTAEVSGAKSRAGIYIGIAAALLLVAGGFWYSQQPGNLLTGLLGGSSSASHSLAPTPEEPAVSAVAPAKHTAASATPAPASLGPAVAPAETAAPQITPAPTFSRNSNFTSTPILRPTPMAPASRSATSTPAQLANNEAPTVEEPKKASLGDVRLATPKLNASKTAASSESAPSIDVNPAGDLSAPVSAISTSRRAEPTAPAPVGGDVKPAKLIKSVPPVYPEMARNQHISGNVQIDALIDAEGNVGAMKVLSGPTLLHQAALTAVRQWKYQPAELDGKPTAMHLTLTVQFRAQ